LYRRSMDGSDNVRGADNQQERLWICGWIAGFVDGEGCFSVPIFRNRKTALHWQVQPQFVVAQSVTSRDALDELVSFFGCGKVYVNQRHDDHREPLALYSVKRFADLRDTIVPFFHEHQLRTSKRESFEQFVRVLGLMEVHKHLTVSGLIEIAEIVETMNRRKPSQVLRILRDHTPTNSGE
jgi:LAGLIDADG endonuclease